MNRCPNCHQPLLPDDTVCWRCQTRVAPLVEPAAEEASTPRDLWTAAPGGMLADLPSGTLALGFYTGVTIILIFLLLLTIGALSRVPLAQVSFGDVIPVGYRVVFDQNQQISFDLPRSWEGSDPLVAADRPVIEQLLAAHDPLWREVTQPWDEVFGDLELLYLALPAEGFEPGADPLVLVAASRSLAGFSPEMVIALVEQEAWLPVRQLLYVADNDKSHVRLDWVTFPLDESRQADTSGYVYLCSQQIVPGRESGVILAVCIPQHTKQTLLESRNAQALRDNVLESFQFLKK